MIKRVSGLLCALMFFTIFALTGCPPPATTKPEPAPSPSPAAIQEKPIGEKPERPAPRPSLEALRKGEAPVTPTSSPLKEIYFDFDRYDLRPDSRETLKANANWLKANPAARVQIEGHADERGTNEYNLALGSKRAQSARDYLATLGIPSGRLSTISYGEEVPVCRERNEGCWQKNRRGRFVILPVKPAS